MFSKSDGKGATRWLPGVVVLLAVVALMAAPGLSDDKKGKPPMSEKEMKEMQAWLQACTPGTHHEHLKQLIGNWNAVTKFWMAPGADPEVSHGLSKTRSILGGRYVVDEYEGMAMGMSFSGFGVSGYDNINKQYVNIWMDTMSTSPMISHGSCDASGKVFTYKGEADDPSKGKKVKTRSIIRIVNEDKFTFEMYGPDESGKEFKNLEVTYTRR